MQRALTSGPITGSILLGLCMGSGAAISMQFGSGEEERMAVVSTIKCARASSGPSPSLRAWRWRTPSALVTIW